MTRPPGRGGVCRAAAPGAQTGAAILMALLTVALVASLASAMLWQQWRGVEVEAAQRARVQAAWVLLGAQDWARLILREDARSGSVDHLAEPWAVALAPARLSSFLAAPQGQAWVGDEGDAGAEAFLSGQIEDLQSRLNLRNLIDQGRIHPPTLALWGRLFDSLNLPQAELQSLAQGLLASQPDVQGAAPDPAAGANPPLAPQTLADLRRLGVSTATLQALAPLVTVLPERTLLNLNTASPQALMASVPGMDVAQAQALVRAREQRHFSQLADAQTALAGTGLLLDAAVQGVGSRYFRITGQLRLAGLTVQEEALVRRDGLSVRTLSRRRTTLAPVASAQGPTLQ